jgi:tungstate transport system ATP-binding protein
MSDTAFAYEVRSLIHSYNGGIALDIPSLDIQSGAVCALTGPNGCGKTTLLSILALLLKPVSGSVRLQGIESAGSHDYHLRRKATLVHQKPVLFSATVRNNIEYGLKAVGIPAKEIRNRVDRILGKANLGEIAEKQARKLSGGEAQRVVLARGLVLETPIVLLDEPTNSLDAASRPLFYNLLREATARGTTIITATHDTGILAALNPRILRMDKGKIVHAPGSTGVPPNAA